MNDIFHDFIRKFVLVFLDDILIYNPTLAAHLEHLQYVCATLRSHQLVAIVKMCVFGQTRVDYLGHVIDA